MTHQKPVLLQPAASSSKQQAAAGRGCFVEPVPHARPVSNPKTSDTNTRARRGQGLTAVSPPAASYRVPRFGCGVRFQRSRFRPPTGRRGACSRPREQQCRMQTAGGMQHAWHLQGLWQRQTQTGGWRTRSIRARVLKTRSIVSKCWRFGGSLDGLEEQQAVGEK